MKNAQSIVSLILILGAPFTSKALVADRFHCQTVAVNQSTKETSTFKSDSIGIRFPLSQSPSPDIRITAAQFQQTLVIEGSGNDYIEVLIASTYQHAVKLDSNQNPMAAQQFICQAASVFNRKSCHEEDSNCRSSSIICVQPKGPFEPGNNWADTHLSNGRPIFANSGPVVFTVTGISKNGVTYQINSSCEFKGTYD